MDFFYVTYKWRSRILLFYVLLQYIAHTGEAIIRGIFGTPTVGGVSPWHPMFKFGMVITVYIFSFWFMLDLSISNPLFSKTRNWEVSEHKHSWVKQSMHVYGKGKEGQEQKLLAGGAIVVGRHLRCINTYSLLSKNCSILSATSVLCSLHLVLPCVSSSHSYSIVIT